MVSFGALSNMVNPCQGWCYKSLMFHTICAELISFLILLQYWMLLVVLLFGYFICSRCTEYPSFSSSWQNDSQVECLNMAHHEVNDALFIPAVSSVVFTMFIGVRNSMLPWCLLDVLLRQLSSLFRLSRSFLDISLEYNFAGPSMVQSGFFRSLEHEKLLQALAFCLQMLRVERWRFNFHCLILPFLDVILSVRYQWI